MRAQVPGGRGRSKGPLLAGRKGTNKKYIRVNWHFLSTRPIKGIPAAWKEGRTGNGSATGAFETLTTQKADLGYFDQGYAARKRNNLLISPWLTSTSFNYNLEFCVCFTNIYVKVVTYQNSAWQLELIWNPTETGLLSVAWQVRNDPLNTETKISLVALHSFLFNSQ